MGTDRRSFLQFAGLAPAAAAASLVAPRVSHAAPAASLTRSVFLPCVGDEFRFELGPLESRAAKLNGIEAIDGHATKANAEGAFRLLFEPASAGSIAQQTYAVTHPGLGRFALFVSPNDAEGRVVEAIFNRL